MRKEIYLIYITSVIVLTVVLSSLIIRSSTTSRFVLITPPIEETNGSCPCKFGVDVSSKCPILFMKDSDNPKLNLELHPGVTQIFDGFGFCIPATTIKINSYGFRDYEYSTDKPTNTFRIVALGDSYTFGQGVELNETYSKVLERMLNEKLTPKTGMRYQVLNFGVPSYNAAEKVEVFFSKAVKFYPDLIIFQYLGDDIVNWTEFRQIEKIKMQEYAQKTNRNVSELTEVEKREINQDTYRAYINMLEEKKFDESWKIVEDGFKQLYSFTQKNNVSVLILADGDSIQLSELDKISRAYNWSILYVKTFLGDYYKNESLIISPKDIHPNALAHRLIAEEIYKMLVVWALLPVPKRV